MSMDSLCGASLPLSSVFSFLFIVSLFSLFHHPNFVGFCPSSFHQTWSCSWKKLYFSFNTYSRVHTTHMCVYFCSRPKWWLHLKFVECLRNNFPMSYFGFCWFIARWFYWNDRTRGIIFSQTQVDTNYTKVLIMAYKQPGLPRYYVKKIDLKTIQEMS